MNTLCGTVLRISSHRIRITLTVLDRLEQVEISDFHLSHHGTLIQHKLYHNNRNHMTAVMYQVTSLICSFAYSMGLKPAGINQLVMHITLYFSTCDPPTSSLQ